MAAMRANTLMWEARAAQGRGPDLLDWVVREALPQVRATPELERAEAFIAADDRVVMIAVGTALPVRMPEPPEELLRRPPHAWPFERVAG
jgi:hypothetical protein